LVDCESRAAEVVFVVPHVAVLELAPLDLVQVEAPDDGHGCGGIPGVIVMPSVCMLCSGDIVCG
jgi:hypothetical protein